MSGESVESMSGRQRQRSPLLKLNNAAQHTSQQPAVPLSEQSSERTREPAVDQLAAQMASLAPPSPSLGPRGPSRPLDSFSDHYSSGYIQLRDCVATVWAYQARANDEFSLSRGDMIKAVGLWDDVWPAGIMLKAKAEMLEMGDLGPGAFDAVNDTIKAFPVGTPHTVFTPYRHCHCYSLSPLAYSKTGGKPLKPVFYTTKQLRHR